MSSSWKGPITVGNQGRTQRPLTLKRKETVLEDLPILEILLTTGYVLLCQNGKMTSRVERAS